MYVPASFDASDVEFCHAVIRAYPFAAVTTGGGGPGEQLVSHVPVLVDEQRGPYGTLIAHVARASPHHDELASGQTTLVVFTGPHAYISPAWYEPAPAVPTWNYCAVHAYGVPRLLDDGATRAYLARLSAHFEGNAETAWRFASLPDEYAAKMVRAIVAFEIEIVRLQGKAKLSQNRSPADQARVANALDTSALPGDRELSRWMRGDRGK
jgi:transcriptional regulator